MADETSSRVPGSKYLHHFSLFSVPSFLPDRAEVSLCLSVSHFSIPSLSLSLALSASFSVRCQHHLLASNANVIYDLSKSNGKGSRRRQFTHCNNSKSNNNSNTTVSALHFAIRLALVTLYTGLYTCHPCQLLLDIHRHSE